MRVECLDRPAQRPVAGCLAKQARTRQAEQPVAQAQAAAVMALVLQADKPAATALAGSRPRAPAMDPATDLRMARTAAALRARVDKAAPAAAMAAAAVR
jgi:hypothetical protein